MKSLFTATLCFLLVATMSACFFFTSNIDEIEPSPSFVIEQTPERLKRGEYLANHVMLCFDCHGDRDFNQYAGPVIPDTRGKGGHLWGEDYGFPGKVYGKNITPYALKDWSDGEIFRAMTTGLRKDGTTLFPMMPYRGYGKADQEDIKSVIAYIRTIPSIKNDIPAKELGFPLNFIEDDMVKASDFTKIPTATDTIAYGKYLVNIASCADCHSEMTMSGELDEDTLFAGGVEFPIPDGTKVVSANITPDKETGIGNWSRETFIQKFKDNDGKRSPLTEGMRNTYMPWISFAGMTEQDLGAIYDYLQTVAPVNNKVERFPPKEE